MSMWDDSCLRYLDEYHVKTQLKPSDQSNRHVYLIKSRPFCGGQQNAEGWIMLVWARKVSDVAQLHCEAVAHGAFERRKPPRRRWQPRRSARQRRARRYPNPQRSLPCTARATIPWTAGRMGQGLPWSSLLRWVLPPVAATEKNLRSGLRSSRRRQEPLLTLGKAHQPHFDH